MGGRSAVHEKGGRTRPGKILVERSAARGQFPFPFGRQPMAGSVPNDERSIDNSRAIGGHGSGVQAVCGKMAFHFRAGIAPFDCVMPGNLHDGVLAGDGRFGADAGGARREVGVAVCGGPVADGGPFIERDLTGGDEKFGVDEPRRHFIQKTDLVVGRAVVPDATIGGKADLGERGADEGEEESPNGKTRRSKAAKAPGRDSDV